MLSEPSARFSAPSIHPAQHSRPPASRTIKTNTQLDNDLKTEQDTLIREVQTKKRLSLAEMETALLEDTDLGAKISTLDALREAITFWNLLPASRNNPRLRHALAHQIHLLTGQHQHGIADALRENVEDSSDIARHLKRQTNATSRVTEFVKNGGSAKYESISNEVAPEFELAMVTAFTPDSPSLAEIAQHTKSDEVQLALAGKASPQSTAFRNLIFTAKTALVRRRLLERAEQPEDAELLEPHVHDPAGELLLATKLPIASKAFADRAAKATDETQRRMMILRLRYRKGDVFQRLAQTSRIPSERKLFYSIRPLEIRTLSALAEYATDPAERRNLYDLAEPNSRVRLRLAETVKSIAEAEHMLHDPETNDYVLSRVEVSLNSIDATQQELEQVRTLLRSKYRYSKTRPLRRRKTSAQHEDMPGARLKKIEDAYRENYQSLATRIEKACVWIDGGRHPREAIEEIQRLRGQYHAAVRCEDFDLARLIADDLYPKIMSLISETSV